MKFYQFSLTIIIFFLLGILTALDLNNFPKKKVYRYVERCPDVSFKQCLDLGGIPIISDNINKTTISCNFKIGIK
jgi:hypothetical protein